jgi:hypothetical protein
MTLDELQALLKGLASGQAAHIPHEVCDELFPPEDDPDYGARRQAHEFAKANGCAMDNQSAQGQVLFVKPN